ncbi:hypothetical protein DFH09DRAFT_1382587 [Mycena vulgaris]|nr:hypothetical protein DFH09DRAFT_1382587 [Mycena vulgaris]
MAFYARNNTDNGEMWINVKRSGGFSRGAYFNENLTIGEFVHQVVRDVSTEEGFQFFQEGWYVEVQSFRKALDPDENVEMIKERFNGAETVTLRCSTSMARSWTTNSDLVIPLDVAVM